MKSLIAFSILSLSTVIAQNPSQEQAGQNSKPVSETVPEQNANSITYEILGHIKAVFLASSKATDEEQAKLTVKSINENTAKIIALSKVLKSVEKPTTEEKKQCAAEMVKFESEISDILKQMSKTFQNNSEEVNKLIEPSMSDSKEKINPTMNLINSYYPKEEMLGYIKALKENK